MLANIYKRWCLAFLSLFILKVSFTQSIDTVVFTPLDDHKYTLLYSAYTSILDKQNRPYIYTASMELGLIVFDISDEKNIVPVDTILPAKLNSLKLTNLRQEGDYLFGSLGGFAGAAQTAGLAIFDVSTPDDVKITSTWDSAAFNQGCAIAIKDRNYAYLGIMELGVVVLDISDLQNPEFVSVFQPDPNWPKIPGLFSTPNARGMTIRNDTLYLTYDAGALRVIDYVDKANPVEIGRYINLVLDSVAQPAYNNILLKENLAFIPVDYCGLDIVDVSNPDSMKTKYWFNPWDCNTVNWNGRPGHTNQLVKVMGDSLLFVSGGDSEILAYDISDLDNIRKVGEFANVGDSLVSWGIEANEEYLVISNVNNPLGIPYKANHGGITLFSWNSILSSTKLEKKELSFNVFPNPFTDQVTIQLGNMRPERTFVSISDITGRTVYTSFVNIQNKVNLSLREVPAGVYLVTVFSATYTRSTLINRYNVNK